MEPDAILDHLSLSSLAVLSLHRTDTERTEQHALFERNKLLTQVSRITLQRLQTCGLQSRTS